MRDLLIASIVFGTLPFVLKRPFWGVLLLAWLGYMNPHRLCYGFMLSFPVVQTVALVTMAGLLVSKDAKKLLWSREMTVLAIFMAWMGLTTMLAYYPEAAFEQYIKIIKIQVLTVMTLMVLTSPERIRSFIWVVVLSLGFYGFKGGIFTIANGGSFHVQGPDGTFIGGNNELALALVMTIPLMRYLQLTETKHVVKQGLTALMMLTAVSAIGSQSRGALVALCLTGGMFWIKGRNKFGTALLVLVGAVIVVSIMPAQWYERMGTIQTYKDDESALGRLNAWHMAFTMASHRFFGGGFESFQPLMFKMFAPEPDDVHDSHSIYFQVMGHHGFVGLAIFLLMLWLTWRKCTAVRRATKDKLESRWAFDLASMLQVSMAAYLSGGAFLGMAYFDYPYHILAIAVVTAHLIDERVRRPAAVQGAVEPAQPLPSTR